MSKQNELRAPVRGYYTAIARKTGYSRPHVSKVLRGVGSYSSESLNRIADACGVSVGWLASYIQNARS